MLYLDCGKMSAFKGLSIRLCRRLLLGFPAILTLSFGSATLANPPSLTEQLFPTITEETCQTPALSRLKTHRIAPGETLNSIAQTYNLIPATLMGFNPILQQGAIPVGQEILIPPYNGIQVTVPAGQTWREVAATYNVRPDILFEVNGCQTSPSVVFVPGVNWTPGRPASPTLSTLQGYPIPNPAPIALGYGWQLHPDTRQVMFHSGLDFLTPVNTPVLPVGQGIVAYAGDRDNYGNLVVINHAAGKQTRYAHLETITVKVGQTVNRGEILGTTGVTGQGDIAAPHLHFEIRYNSPLGWVAEDPTPYLNRSQTSSGFNPTVIESPR